MASPFLIKIKSLFSGNTKPKENHSDIVLTGVPRSGTTLCCYLLNQLPNIVALNEPIMVGRLRSKEAALAGITDFYKNTRLSLIHEGTAIARATETGVPDNNFANTGTREAVVKKQRIHFDKPLDESMILAVKHNAFFTILLDEVRQNYPTFAIIRNPLAVLGSWNSVDIPAAKGRVRAAEWLAPDMVSTLEKIPDKYDKQIFIMDWYYKRYLALPRKDVLKYEIITATGGKALERITPEAIHLNEGLKSKNQSSLYNTEVMKVLAEKLIAADLACWEFYDRKEVEQLLS